MKVLVIGSGGREHALCWKIAQSPKVTELYCAPGNAGTSQNAKNVDIKADDIEGLMDFAKRENIELTCVGPEGPLVKGIVDLFTENGLKIFGPSKKAAALEGSKIFAKKMMVKFNVPTAGFKIFDNAEEAKAYAEKKDGRVVIKADGLAAGKGVTVASTKEEAFSAIDDALTKKIFGKAGNKILIEDTLIGEEASILVITDGKNKLVLDTSQDYKRAHEGDRGPNTGGMGACSPVPSVTKELYDRIINEVADPLISGMAREEEPYKGVLYAGIMLTDQGPMVLEFNVRFGDPETQAVLTRMNSDLVELMEASIDGTLNEHRALWDERKSLCVVISSGGYPGSYQKGKIINGLENIDENNDVVIFHAGTALADGKTVTNGGRILNVVGLGDTIRHAADKAYEVCGKIQFENMFYRKDIGYKVMDRL